MTCVIVPHDTQREEYDEPEHDLGMQHSSVALSAPRVVPRDEDLRRAAELLNAGKRVAILAGAGALHATDELIAVAERLGAGIAKALLGKASVPDDLPFVTGSVGWLGTRASNEMMKECDTLLMVGTSFPYTEFLPVEGQAKGVQIDIAPENLAVRYPMDVALVGNSAETLRALLPLLRERTADAWRRNIRVERPDQVGPAWDEALASDRPVVIDVLVNANIPTVPPTLRPKQAQQLEHALADDPDAPGVREQMKRQEIHSEDQKSAKQPSKSASAGAQRSRARRSHR